MRAAMTAERVARALGGRKVGSRWMARCPAHADHNPSLSIQSGNDGKILVCCFAGCEQHRVIAILKARGLWRESGRGNAKGMSRSFMPADRIGARDAEMRQLAARILERTTAAGGRLSKLILVRAVSSFPRVRYCRRRAFRRTAGTSGARSRCSQGPSESSASVALAPGCPRRQPQQRSWG